MGVHRIAIKIGDHGAFSLLPDSRGEYVQFRDYEALRLKLAEANERYADIKYLVEANTGFDSVTELLAVYATFQQQLDEITATLRYDYLDPPDGGGPSIVEQVRRMATDASRYRKIRNDLRYQITIGAFDPVEYSGDGCWTSGDPGEKLDEMLDKGRE